MSLKYATFQFTEDNGETVTRVAHVKKTIIHYDEKAVETIYELYPNLESQVKGAVPRLISQRILINLENEEDRNFILSGSNLLWEKNRSEPFILDYSELDDNGKMTGRMKSLDELGAIIKIVESN